MVSILSQHSLYKQVWERTLHVESLVNGSKPLWTLSLQAGLRTHLARGIACQWFQTSLNTLFTSRFENAPCTWNPFLMVSILCQHSPYKQVWERTLHVESFFQWSQSFLHTLLTSRFENAPCTWNPFSMISILSKHSLYKQVWERTLHVESFFNDLNPL